MKITVLSSGSKGNSSLIISEECKLLIDLGTTCSYILNKLDDLNIKPEEIDAILVTHIHSDHIKGLKTFIRKYKTTVYTTTKLLGLLEKEIGKFDYCIYDEESTIIKDIKINIFKTSHDAGESLGFLIENNKKTLVYITDTGYINTRYHEMLKNKDMYIIESNHDIKMLVEGPYPYYLQARVRGDKGHLSNKQASNYFNDRPLSKYGDSDFKSYLLNRATYYYGEMFLRYYDNEMKRFNETGEGYGHAIAYLFLATEQFQECSKSAKKIPKLVNPAELDKLVQKFTDIGSEMYEKIIEFIEIHLLIYLL